MGEQMKTKIMFDTNEFDKVLDSNIDPDQITDKYEVYVTLIQMEEIRNIPESKKEKREKLLNTISKLKAISIPTPFTWDYFNFASFSFSIEPAYWKVLKQTKANRNDALIAATAIHEECVLVTEDKEILRDMKKLNKPAYTFIDFSSTI